ncbi:hypothetical protein WN55_03967 [Dufourea novaeangliae]|uniref:Uncharacterized protein n=1 Tax=Dufourea novaeangliae TaxID=178035 RepID=A0A154PMJ1_DUFNO|nr:hypothetical protein WN55_03967 [Dufourea novaeangliae]
MCETACVRIERVNEKKRERKRVKKKLYRRNEKKKKKKKKKRKRTARARLYIDREKRSLDHFETINTKKLSIGFSIDCTHRRGFTDPL